jgi:integrase
MESQLRVSRLAMRGERPLIAMLRFETGCRRGEMLKIRNRDVDWTKHRIALPARNTKSGKRRVIPFDPQGRLAERCVERAHRKARANTEALKKLNLHWHDLRHECASRWRESGLDLEVIRRLLGQMQQKIWKGA